VKSSSRRATVCLILLAATLLRRPPFVNGVVAPVVESSIPCLMTGDRRCAAGTAATGVAEENGGGCVVAASRVALSLSLALSSYR
jgi:hypothetical protein